MICIMNYLDAKRMQKALFCIDFLEKKAYNGFFMVLSLHTPQENQELKLALGKGRKLLCINIAISFNSYVGS